VRLAKLMSAIAVMMAVSAFPATAFAGWQHRGGAAPTQHEGSPTNNSQTPTFHLNGPGPHRGDWLRKYSSLPPSQQEKQLRSDPSFRSLPPQKQTQLMNRLREFNSRPPEQKAQILNRMETFEHMTPQQQQQARNLFGQYRALPDDQRNKVLQAYRRLRGMPPSARNELLNSDEFKNNFTDDQRNLLRGMSDLYLPSGH
jgi:hypothetical protein